MQKVVGLFDYLKENTFYTTQLEKDTFTADEKSVMDAFFFSFVGWVSLLASAKNRVKVKTYFKNDKKLRLSAIDDSNNDTSLIVKIMADGSYFKTVLTPTQITRFLVKARQGQIDDVDPNILRGWLGEIKPDKLLKANVKVRKSVDDFIGDNTFNLYSLGNVSINLPSISDHREILAGFGGSHAIIYSPEGRTKLLNASGNMIDLDLISSIPNKFKHKYPLVCQTFPDTEQKKEWEHLPGMFVMCNITKFLNGDKVIEPFWSSMYLMCDCCVYIVILIVILIIIKCYN